MYQMLTGILPYETPSPAELAEADDRRAGVAAPRCAIRSCPKAVNDIVMKAHGARHRLALPARRATCWPTSWPWTGRARAARPHAGRRAGRRRDSAHMHDIHSRLRARETPPATLLLALPQADARPLRPLPVLRRERSKPRSSTGRRLRRRSGTRFRAVRNRSQIATECHGDKVGKEHVMSFGTGKDLDERLAGGLGRREDPRRVARRSTTARASSRARAATARPRASACFRLDEHVVRLLDSAKIYRMDSPLDQAGWENGDPRHDPRERS